MPVRRRVAITGVGLVTPLGNTAVATWDALLSVQSGVGPITSFDASGYPVRIAAEVKDFHPTLTGANRKLLKYAARHASFALGAAQEALADAAIHPEPATSTRWGCVVGSGMMGVAFAELAQFQRQFAPAGAVASQLLFDPAMPAPDPVAYARTQANSGLGLLAQGFGIHGYASSVHTACASGGQAIGLGMRLIRRGTADFVLAGGFDSMINPVGLAGFCMLGALSTDNDIPHRASRPFDRTRNGFVLGEGAGFLVLEEWQAARRRGARIYAELAGDGNSLSSYRITDSHPSGDGPIQAMRWALADAEVNPSRGWLHQRPWHLDDDERPQRMRRNQGGVWPRCRTRRGEFNQEPDGPSDRGRGRGGGRGVRVIDSPRDAPGQRQPRRTRSGLRSQLHPRTALVVAHRRRHLQLVRFRRLQ